MVKATTRFIRNAVSKPKDSSYNDPVQSWAATGSLYWGTVEELSASEIETTGRILSEATAKIILNNQVDISEEDRITDKRTSYQYSIDGINVDYIKDITILYVHRLKSGVTK